MEKSLDLKAMRHMLASIDIEDIEEELVESDQKQYDAAISAVFPHLEKDIKRFLHQQLLFANNTANDMNQVAFARGTFNGMDILLEHWRKAHLRHTAKPQEQKDDENILEQDI